MCEHAFPAHNDEKSCSLTFLSHIALDISTFWMLCAHYIAALAQCHISS